MPVFQRDFSLSDMQVSRFKFGNWKYLKVDLEIAHRGGIIALSLNEAYENGLSGCNAVFHAIGRLMEAA